MAGKYNGIGIYYWSPSIKYYGEFIKGEIWGKGLKYYKNG